MISDYYFYDDFNTYFKKMKLNDLQKYMFELLKSLEFIHKKGIIHRDIKPQNILYSIKNQKMKIIDFGQAIFYQPEGQLSTKISSRYFKAPELLMDYPFYTYAVDIWAAGIIFISIIFDRFPFFIGNDAHDQLLKIVEWAGTEEYMKFQFNYRRNSENKILNEKKKTFAEVAKASNKELATEEAIDLASKLLSFDFDCRISAKEALSHSFFKYIN